jgi:histone H3/H4
MVQKESTAAAKKPRARPPLKKAATAAPEPADEVVVAVVADPAPAVKKSAKKAPKKAVAKPVARAPPKVGKRNDPQVGTKRLRVKRAIPEPENAVSKKRLAHKSATVGIPTVTNAIKEHCVNYVVSKLTDVMPKAQLVAQSKKGGRKRINADDMAYAIRVVAAQTMYKSTDGPVNPKGSGHADHVRLVNAALHKSNPRRKHRHAAPVEDKK